jgi:arginyl-tRNA--protein-N-Asp/Glu arginylyltransferase
MILDHLAQARQHSVPHVYLGYWVRGSEKMSYKARFDPVEILRPDGWRRMDDADRSANAPKS